MSPLQNFRTGRNWGKLRVWTVSSAEMYAQKQDIFYEEIFSDGGVVVKIGLLFYGGGVGSSHELDTFQDF